MADKNPHTSDTPEWQLWENMTSCYLQAQAYAADAERYQKLSQTSREKGDKFKVALERLSRS